MSVVSWVLGPIAVWLGVLALRRWAALRTARTHVDPAHPERAAVPLAGRLGLVARETLARALMQLTWPVGTARRRPVPHGLDPDGPPEKPVPVLLVADPDAHAAAWTGLSIFLHHHGWRWTWAVGPGRGRLAERARHVEQAVATLVEGSGRPTVDVVAHGVSGLAVAWWLTHAEPDSVARVRRFVALGTPWAGTRAAWLRRRALDREVVPGSPALDGLADLPVPSVSVWSPHSPAVLPAESAIARGSHEVCLDRAGHLELLLSPRTYRAVQAALESPA